MPDDTARPGGTPQSEKERVRAAITALREEVAIAGAEACLDRINDGWRPRMVAGHLRWSKHGHTGELMTAEERAAHMASGRRIAGDRSIALDAGCANCSHEVLMHVFDGDGEFWRGARCAAGDATVVSGVEIVPASEPCSCEGLVPRG